QIFIESPDVHAYSFELWAPNYAGLQGTPETVMTKLESLIGRRPQLRFVNGNSHETLLRFFANQLADAGADAPQEFDVIVVDCDQSRAGAWWDLTELFGRVRIGGALLFDDLHWEGDEILGAAPSTEFDHPPLPANAKSLLDL